MTKKTTETYAKQILDKHGLQLLGEYTAAHGTVEFLCINKHYNRGVATNILQRGYKCKECLHGRVIDSKIYWDTDKLQRLKQCMQQHKSLEEIAEYFHTTTAAINNVLAEHDLQRAKKDFSLLDLISVLLDQGRELITTPEQYLGLKSLVEVRCAANHTVKQEAGNIVDKHTNCPKCFHGKGTSQGEQSLVDFVQEHYKGWIVQHDRQLLQGKELDLILPDLGLCFEYNGSYWHSEHKISEQYHLEKTQQVEAYDYQLIHIGEYHWINKQSIVKSRILSLLKLTTKISARKCQIKKLTTWPKEFLDTTHLQGSGSPTGINYGLYYDHELCAVMTFSKSRYRKDYQYELVRYSQKLNTTVVGGASRLLKQFTRDYKPQSLCSYANRDFSRGNVYHQLGFQLIDITTPGYTYNKRGEQLLLSRHQFQKHKLAKKLEHYDETLTELENMHIHNYYRVYDSGNLVYGIRYPRR